MEENPQGFHFVVCGPRPSEEKKAARSCREREGRLSQPRPAQLSRLSLKGLSGLSAQPFFKAASLSSQLL